MKLRIENKATMSEALGISETRKLDITTLAISLVTSEMTVAGVMKKMSVFSTSVEEFCFAVFILGRMVTAIKEIGNNLNE